MSLGPLERDLSDFPASRDVQIRHSLAIGDGPPLTAAGGQRSRLRGLPDGGVYVQGTRGLTVTGQGWELEVCSLSSGIRVPKNHEKRKSFDTAAISFPARGRHTSAELSKAKQLEGTTRKHGPHHSSGVLINHPTGAPWLSTISCPD